MTFVVSGKITADPAQAKKGLGEVGGAVEKLGDKARVASGSLDHMATSARVAGGAVGGAVKLSNQQLANMQFQLQDIGVGLASGQSPFLVMAQQGSQIVQMFGPGTGVLGALKALGGGIVSFLTNPLNLALVGIAGVTAGASALYRVIVGDGAGANETIEEQAKRVREVSKAFADTIPVLREYNKEREKAEFKSKTEKTLDEQRADALTKLNEKAKELSSTLSSAVFSLDLPTDQLGAIRDIRKAFADALAKAREGKDASKEFADALQRLSAIGNTVKLPGLVAAQADLKRLADLAEIAAGKVANIGKVRAEIGDDPLAASVIARLKAEIDALGKTAEQRQRDNELKAAGVSITSKYGSEIADLVRQKYALKAANEAAAKAERDAASAARQNAAEAKRAQAQFDAKRAAVGTLITSLETEIAVMRESDPVQKEMLRLRETLSYATEGERLAIEKKIATQIKESAATAKASERMAFFEQQTLGALDELIFRGASAADVMKNLEQAIAKAAIQAALFGSGPLGSSSGGGLIPSIVKAFSGAGQPMDIIGSIGSAKGNVFAGGNIVPFAAGGIVDRPTIFPMKNGTGLMGEAGPEGILPLRRGPTGRLGVEVTGGGGREGDVFVYNYPAPGTEIETRKRRGSGGQKIVENFVKQTGKRYGLTQPATRV